MCAVLVRESDNDPSGVYSSSRSHRWKGRKVRKEGGRVSDRVTVKSGRGGEEQARGDTGVLDRDKIEETRHSASRFAVSIWCISAPFRENLAWLRE